MATEKQLIDANELLRFLENEIDKYEGALNKWERDYVKAVRVAVKIIRCFPTVDAVEVVHGRWEDGVCSACGFNVRDLIDGESNFNNWVWEGLPYCPDCGAKMDGGNEDG